jgi:hypothetical protein
MRRYRSFVIIFFTFLIVFFGHQQSSLAATKVNTPTPKGITLSPALESVKIQSTEPEHQLTFYITNHKNTPQTINIKTADFNTLDETGGLVFVGSNPTQLQKKYGLASWISLPQSTITVQPNQSANLTAFILNLPSLSSGGHYGALMLQLDGNSGSSSKSNEVSVQPIASSLLFVDKAGGDTHFLSLANVYATHNLFSLPSSVTLRFKNNGNTHLIPRGIITITDPSGKLVSKGVINENSGIILPETYRRYSVPLNKVASSTHPGKYKMHVDFRFDGYEQYRSYQTSMFLLASWAVAALAVLIVLAALAYVFMKKTTVKKYFVTAFKKHKNH